VKRRRHCRAQVPAHRLRARGQAAVEFALLAAAVALVLFAGDPSLATRLLQALDALYRALLFALSLP
jgi:Flp pilus assembly pilin Flp